MSSMSYQSPDASQNVELKKGNIASFFKSGASAKTATAATKTPAAGVQIAPHASTQAQQETGTVMPDVTDGHHACLYAFSANSASEVVTGTDCHQGKHDKSGDGDTEQQQHSQPQNTHQTAGPSIIPEGADPADSKVVKDEPAEGDVLNTDDAGGIGALYLLHCECLSNPSLYDEGMGKPHRDDHVAQLFGSSTSAPIAVLTRLLNVMSSSDHVGVARSAVVTMNGQQKEAMFVCSGKARTRQRTTQQPITSKAFCSSSQAVPSSHIKEAQNRKRHIVN